MIWWYLWISLKYEGVSKTSIFFLNALMKNSNDSLDFLSTFFQLSVKSLDKEQLKPVIGS